MSSTPIAESIEQYLTEALGQLGAEPSQISRSATFKQLDLDSLDLVELSQMLEETQGIHLTTDDVRQIESVGDAIDLILAKQSG